MVETVVQRKDAAFLVAKNAVAMNYERLPAEVVDRTKKCILDTLGVILGASGMTPEIKTLAEMMKEVGGKQESTMLGFGERVPVWHAGYVNGAASHCLDYDDFQHSGGLHISGPTVPAPVALAERQRASGKDLIAAAAAGLDLSCRINMAVPSQIPKKRFHYTVAGFFGSALACSKLLGLDEDKTADALGIAFTQAAGTVEIPLDIGSNMRGLCNAASGEVGVRAALMAQKGIKGITNTFEGQAGLINVYFLGEYDRTVLVGDLGKRFPLLDDGFKPWPCCGGIHIYIDLTLELMREHDIRPAQIESIMVTVGDSIKSLCCEPLEMRRRPPTIAIAQFSIPYTLAVAAARGKVVLGDYTVPALSDPVVLDLARRVSYSVDPEYDTIEHQGKVEIMTRDGKTYSRKGHIPYGSPRKPLSWDDLVAKFKDCARFAHKPIPQANVDKVAQLLLHLEDVTDVSQIIRLLS